MQKPQWQDTPFWNQIKYQEMEKIILLKGVASQLTALQVPIKRKQLFSKGITQMINASSSQCSKTKPPHTHLTINSINIINDQ